MSDQVPSVGVTLDSLETAIRTSFALDTCSPDDVAEWSAQNPSRGHCAMAALTVHQYLGGELLCAEVCRSGERFGYHWWNRLDDGDFDFTLDQFAANEIVGEPRPVEIPEDQEHLYSAQHRIFVRRVADALSGVS